MESSGDEVVDLKAVSSTTKRPKKAKKHKKHKKSSKSSEKAGEKVKKSKSSKKKRHHDTPDHEEELTKHEKRSKEPKSGVGGDLTSSREVVVSLVSPLPTKRTRTSSSNNDSGTLVTNISNGGQSKLLTHNKSLKLGIPTDPTKLVEIITKSLDTTNVEPSLEIVSSESDDDDG